VVALLAGCTGAPSDRALEAQQPTSIWRAPSPPILFVADFAGVTGYDPASGRAVETLNYAFGLPAGLASAADGSLYVADSTKHQIEVFPPGVLKPALILRDRGNFPQAVCIASNGDVGVTNAGVSGGASIGFYHAGEREPYAALSAPFLEFIDSCAYDAAGNAYVTGRGTSTRVGYIAGGGSGSSIVDLGIADVAAPGGVQVLHNGDVAINDEHSFIHEYLPDSNTEVRTVSLDGTCGLVEFVFAPNERAFWAADFCHGAALEYSWPRGGAPRKTFVRPPLPRHTFATGVAIVPPHTP
jgi:hypothetical protein